MCNSAYSNVGDHLRYEKSNNVILVNKLTMKKLTPFLILIAKDAHLNKKMFLNQK